MQRFFDKVRIAESGCWNWTAAKRGGYGCIKISGKTVDAHRVSFEIHIGDIPNGMLVCHSCDNRLCVNPTHLFLGTYSDNMQDCSKKGRLVVPVGNRFKNGHTPNNSVLSKDQVSLIKEAIRNKVTTLKKLSESMNISYQKIRDLNSGRSYK